MDLITSMTDWPQDKRTTSKNAQWAPTSQSEIGNSYESVKNGEIFMIFSVR